MLVNDGGSVIRLGNVSGNANINLILAGDSASILLKQDLPTFLYNESLLQKDFILVELSVLLPRRPNFLVVETPIC
jgi:hypothetical protein